MSAMIHLQEILKRDFVYIYGPPGIGKTWAVKNTLTHYIELDDTVLCSLQKTQDFLDRINRKIFIDDWDIHGTLPGAELITKGIIIGNKPWSRKDVPYMYEFPHMKREDMLKLNPDEQLVDSCKGDLRILLKGPSHDKDLFPDTKDFVSSLICTHGTENPLKYIGDTFDTPGHIMDIVFDSYIYSTSCDPCIVLHALENASILDSLMYTGDWTLMPYFTNESLIIPAYHIQHSIPEIKSGSMWTKYCNMCNRRSKLKNIRQSLGHLDKIFVLGEYFNKGIGDDFIKEYNITSDDLNTMNHLYPLKPKIISRLKKIAKSV